MTVIIELIEKADDSFGSIGTSFDEGSEPTSRSALTRPGSTNESSSPTSWIS